MRSEEYEPVLQDQFFTVRAERFVLPLKASAKSLGLGIVHDTSRTGETVFVEPTALVSANNRLKVVELDIRRESRRILEALTADVAVAASALRASAAVLAALDALAASARLGIGYGGTAIEIVDEPVVDLRQARHPLLALAHAGGAARSSPTTSRWAGAAPRILIVSGPNAGGKTVLMKTVGLAALMARAGLLVAAAPGSRIGFFDAVLADIGDRQSVLGDLSTFSGHLANVGEILNAPDRAAPALVLLDELMAGTNPEQGAALARATRGDAGGAAGAGGDHHPLRQPEGAGRERRALRQRGHGVRPRTAAPDVPAGDRRAGAVVRVRHRGAHGAAGAAARAGARAGGRLERGARVGDRAAGGARGGARRATGRAARRGRSGGAARRPTRSALPRRRSPGASASWAHKAREAVEAAVAEAREEIRGGRPARAGGGHRARGRGGARGAGARRRRRRWRSSRVRTRRRPSRRRRWRSAPACAWRGFGRTASSRSSRRARRVPR